MNPNQVFRNWRKLLEAILSPKLKRVANKYTITDSGGNGDVTKPTHLFYLHMISINREKHELRFIPFSDFPNGEMYSLETLQTKIPADVYGALMLKLVNHQQQREELERHSLTIKKSKAA